MAFKLPFWSPAQAEAVIFDWDGVIAETRLDFSDIRRTYYGEREAMILEDAATLPPAARFALMRDLEDLEVAGAEKAEIVRGVIEVIDWFETKKIPWAVSSRNCKKSITIAAEKISIKLPDVVRSREDGPVKPDPRALFEICGAIGAEPSQTLLIGDYVYDMMGARRAGMRGALVRGHMPPEWGEWVECHYRSMSYLSGELNAPSELTPWENQRAGRRIGKAFLRAASTLALMIPSGVPNRTDESLMTAASLGVGAFMVPDVLFSPEEWKGSPSFNPDMMGRPLIDAVRDLLGARFPLVKVLPRKGEMDRERLPNSPDGMEAFLRDILSI
ncbi:haloacid dehalogenase [Synergistales bacterium]|nr:haloacid dehalogenase [Synergistales bacterium]